MKYTICLPRPDQRCVFYDEVVNARAKALAKGYIIDWGKNGKLKAITEPIYDGTLATELGYISLLIDASPITYLGDKIRFSNCGATLQKGWPEKGTVKRYLGE